MQYEYVGILGESCQVFVLAVLVTGENHHAIANADPIRKCRNNAMRYA